MAGTLVIDTLNASTGPLSTNNGMTGIAKAWANISGTTPSLNQGFNISSITRASTGNFVINFSSVMANVYYVVNASSWQSTNTNNVDFNIYYQTTSAVTINCYEGGVSVNPSILFVSVFGI